MSTVESLNQQLEEARAAYYAGSPIMSDAEYDVLEAQLEGLNRQQPEGSSTPSVLATVGTDVAGRIPHAHPMRSIRNFYSVDEVVAWYQETIPDQPVSVSSKWDGVSGSLTYVNRELTKAVTRGDGDAGESVFDQVSAISSIPKLLSSPAFPTVEVRGEFVMRRSVMEELNREIVAAGGKPYVSTRNLVAGTLKLKDAAEIAKRGIEFRPWEVFADPGEVTINFRQWMSAVGLLKLIVPMGFAEPDDQLAQSADELRQLLETLIPALNEPDAEIGRDGIVIKADDVNRRGELGLGSKFANYQICFKAQNAKTESVLKDVIWQVGRQGRLTPVGIIEPVVLAGATIERVTLNNLTWIQEMGLKIGSRIVIMRSGDVIPKVVEVLDESEI